MFLLVAVGHARTFRTVDDFGGAVSAFDVGSVLEATLGFQEELVRALPHLLNLSLVASHKTYE
jgi:hypothetical protein